MALILSGVDEQLAKLWLKIFIRTAKKAPSTFQMSKELTDGPYVVSETSPLALEHITNGIEDIWSCIVNRTWLFMDDALADMANGGTRSKRVQYILPHVGQLIQFSPQQLANALAYMCQVHQIYWDDLNPDFISQQIESFKRTTFGKALKSADCFVSQQVKLRGSSAQVATPTTASSTTAAPTTSPASATQTTTISTSTTSPATTAAAQTSTTPANIPVNGKASRRITGTAKIPYKTSGPQSGNVPALNGTPGQKFGPLQSLYWVVSCKSKKNNKRNFAFCYPIKGPYGPLKMKNGGAEILWGDPSGYTSCVLYFPTQQGAINALDMLKNKYAGTTTWQLAEDSGVSVVQAKADPNGYYQITLQDGTSALIRAQNLNQKLIKE